MNPSTTATLVSSHSRVKTESTRPPRTTRSAGSSPRATARRRARSTLMRHLILSWRPSTLFGRGGPEPPLARRGAAPEGGAARRAPDPGRHRRDGRAQLRPRAPTDAPEPERGRGAARLVARGRDGVAGRRAHVRGGDAPAPPRPPAGARRGL